MPFATRLRSRAASVSRGAPVLATISSNRRQPRNTSRTASRAHFSPTTSRLRATEQVRGAVVPAATPTSYACQSTFRTDPVYGQSEIQTDWPTAGVPVTTLAETRTRPSTVAAATPALAVLSLAVFMSSLDLFIVNLAF